MAANRLINGHWLSLSGSGYTVDVTHYSNKGPLFVIRDSGGEEVGRGWFDLSTGEWHISADSAEKPESMTREERERRERACPQCGGPTKPIRYRPLNEMCREDWEEYERNWIQLRDTLPQRPEPLPRKYCPRCRHDW